MGLKSFCRNCCCPKKEGKEDHAERRPSIRTVSENAADEDSEENLEMSQTDIEAHYKDLRNIYQYAIETMKNFLGTTHYPFNTLPKQLYPYILYLCEGLQPHEYVAIKEMLADKPLSKIRLTVIIKDARLIHPKVTDFSQVFCKLWINDANEQLTTVKENASYLLWDETFILDVIDYESEVIHVEIWATRPEPERMLEKINTHTVDSFKEDDPLAAEKGMYFVGDAFEYIKTVPCTGESSLWILKKGPRRAYTKGQINVYLQLGTEKDPDYLLHLYCHMTFMRLCYEKEVCSQEGSSEYWKNWLEILPNAALTLIQQHAIQHGITPEEQCLCSWLVASSLKMRCEDRISFYLLRDVIENVLANINEIIVEQMKVLFKESVSDFSMYSLDQLSNLHENFNVRDIEMANELFSLLRCMSLVELKLCTNYMDSFEVIEEEAFVWYLQTIKDMKKEFEDDESIEALTEVLKNIMKAYIRNQIVLDDIFKRAWSIRYSCITYKKMDRVMCVTIKPMIQHIIIMMDDPKRKCKTSESLLMLQLYHNVRNLVNYIIESIPSQKAFVQMDAYSAWFGEELVLEWFLLCDLYTSQFIERAVLVDPMEKISPEIVHGTSVPDVIAIIDEMVLDVWTKLKWRDQFYTHGALIEATKACIVYYSKSLIERIQMEKYFCRYDDFRVTKKLCVALSSLYAMSEHLLKTSKKIKQELKVAEAALGFELSQPWIEIQSEMQVLTSKIFLLVLRKISNRTKQLIKPAIKKNSEPLNMVELNLYVDKTLEMLYTNLQHEAFYVTLRHMWVILLKRLKGGFKIAQRCFLTQKGKTGVYMTILQILNQMKGIFFCDGHGLTEHEMENSLYEGLKYDIESKLAQK